MKKVVLFTSFAPNIGGGAVNINSIIPHFQDIQMVWLYLHDKDIQVKGCTQIEKPLSGGKLWKDLINSLLLWLGFKTKKFQIILNKVSETKADIYWIVGLNEGALVARELARITNTPIHLTVQDDLPYGVFARSRRYRWLSGIAQQRFAEAMRFAVSVDVTSDGMRDYYQRTLGINGIVIHPYVPSLPKLTPIALDPQSLTIGHIGTIYSADEFCLFCQALQFYARSKKLRVQIVMIGLARKFSNIFAEFSELIIDIPQMAESQAIEQLSRCNFVYAMYPFESASAVFRQTSLPTKLTTYIQVQRPIFAHTPDDSSLAAAIAQYQLGLICNSLKIEDLTTSIGKICHYQLDLNCFEKARAGLYGMDNVTRLETCLKQAT